jgi:hypothetical protein
MPLFSTLLAVFVAFFFFLTTRGLEDPAGSFDFTIGGALDGLVWVLIRKFYLVL